MLALHNTFRLYHGEGRLGRPASQQSSIHAGGALPCPNQHLGGRAAHCLPFSGSRRPSIDGHAISVPGIQLRRAHGRDRRQLRMLLWARGICTPPGAGRADVFARLRGCMAAAPGLCLYRLAAATCPCVGRCTEPAVERGTGDQGAAVDGPLRVEALVLGGEG